MNNLSMKQAITITILCLLVLSGCANRDWRTASREPAGNAVNPSEYKDAVIEFYAADAFSWRGWFAVHTWIALKPKDADTYTVYEVVGWRVRSGRSALRVFPRGLPCRAFHRSTSRPEISPGSPCLAP